MHYVPTFQVEKMQCFQTILLKTKTKKTFEKKALLSAVVRKLILTFDFLTLIEKSRVKHTVIGKTTKINI